MGGGGSGGGGWVGGGGGGGPGWCERRIKVFVKIEKKKLFLFFFGGGGGLGRGGGGGGPVGRGQGGCELRIEVFVKIQKKMFFFLGGGRVWGGGVRVDVIEELKVLENSQQKKKNWGGGWGLGRWGGRVGVGGSGWM